MSFFSTISGFFGGLLQDIAKSRRYQNMTPKELAAVTAEAFRDYHRSLNFLKDAKDLPKEKQEDFIEKGLEFIQYDRKKISDIFMYSALPPIGRLKILDTMDEELNFRVLEDTLGIEHIS